MRATAQAPTPVPSPAGRLMGWARQGVESFVTAQNILLDLTAQQNALAIGVLRERLNVRQLWPRFSITESADRGVASLTMAGKILLDLAAGESALLAAGVKEGLRLSPRTGAVADLLSARLETLIEMPRRWLDLTAEQTHSTIEAFNDGRGLQIGAGLRELARQGVIGCVETEKRFLDIAAEQVGIVLQPPKDAKKPVRARGKALAHIAHESIDKFADAQKQLVDLAVAQVSSNGNTEAEEAEEEPRTPLAEVTRKGFQNIVTAQKALMDVAIKPIRPALKEEAPKPAGRPKRKR